MGLGPPVRQRCPHAAPRGPGACLCLLARPRPSSSRAPWRPPCRQLPAETPPPSSGSSTVGLPLSSAPHSAQGRRDVGTYLPRSLLPRTTYVPDCTRQPSVASGTRSRHVPKTLHQALEWSWGLNANSTWRQNQHSERPPQNRGSEGPPGPFCTWQLDSRGRTPRFSDVCWETPVSHDVP